MIDELRAYFEQDDNIQAIGTGENGRTVMYVLDDAPELTAPYIQRDGTLQVIRCSGFGIGPPHWTQETEPLAYKQRMRPVPGGVSVAEVDVTAGTVSGYVTDNLTGDLCLLSNHHVLVSPMDVGPVGSNIVQPGPADGGVMPNDLVARLVRWVNIREENISRFVDCAIAKPVSPDMIDQNIIAIGMPQGMTTPYIGQELIKSGRSSETTRGQCVVIEADVKVNYGLFSRTIQRCIITGVPSEPGDSGSMMVDMASHDAVALLFAGGSLSDGTRITVGCRMDLVEQLLNVTVPEPPEKQRQFWLDLSHWQGDITSLADDMTGEFKANIEGLTPQSFSEMVAHGVDGVVLKASQGRDILDPKFEDYYTKARAMGLQVAAYVYVDPQYSAAEHFANLMRAIDEHDLAFVAMDCEAASGQSSQTITAVIQQLGELLTRQFERKPWIYTSLGFWNQYVLSWSGWADYPLWAAYWSRIALSPGLPEAWKGVPGQPHMWQFWVSNFGNELGVESRQVDLNTMYRSGIALLGEQEPPPMVTLEIIINGHGYVSPGEGRYPIGSTVTLTATPDNGWRFASWGNDAEGTNPVTTVLMNDSKLVSANFVEAQEDKPAEYIHNRATATVGLNYRTGPGTTYARIGTMPTGTIVDVLGVVQQGTNTWAQIGYQEFAAMVYNGQTYLDYVMEGEWLASLRGMTYGKPAGLWNRFVNWLSGGAG